MHDLIVIYILKAANGKTENRNIIKLQKLLDADVSNR
jgi:hypothetical protein